MKSCIDCLHIRTCSIQNDTVKLLAKNSTMLPFNSEWPLYGDFGDTLNRAFADICLFYEKRAKK